MLGELVPGLSRLAVISDPTRPWLRVELESAARLDGLTLRFIEVSDSQELDDAFRVARGAQAALVLGDPLTVHNLRRIQSLAATHRVPTTHMNLEFARLGGLMAYGVDPDVVLRRIAEYVDRILKGESPANLPIERVSEYKLVVNLQTARVFGLSVPESILLQADEVIR
jgi:putative tryptophan/tyrosine transport system substrate-binding protein